MKARAQLNAGWRAGFQKALTLILVSCCMATQTEVQAQPRAKSQAESQGRRSLEDWLDDVRERRSAEQGQIEALLAGIKNEIQSPRTHRSERRRNELTKRMVDLGTEAVPLIVDWIEPGAAATKTQLQSAGLVVAALVRMNCGVVETQLFKLLDTGSPHARTNAATILGNSKRPERIAPKLLERFRSTNGSQQLAILQALVQLPGESRRAALSEVINGKDKEQTDSALFALAELKAADFAPEVQSLLSDRARAIHHAAGLLAFCTACPDFVEKEQLEQLVELASTGGPSIGTRVKILENLHLFTSRLSSSSKTAVQKLKNHPDDDLAEAAMITLSRMGDRRMRKELLEPYDEAIKDAGRWPQRWVDRADMHYRMGDYSAAISDYKEALSVSKNGSQLPARVYVQLARSYALTKKLKDAANWLERAPLTIQELQPYAKDPAFAELVASSRYRRVFRLE